METMIFTGASVISGGLPTYRSNSKGTKSQSCRRAPSTVLGVNLNSVRYISSGFHCGENSVAWKKASTTTWGLNARDGAVTTTLEEVVEEAKGPSRVAQDESSVPNGLESVSIPNFEGAGETAASKGVVNSNSDGSSRFKANADHISLKKPQRGTTRVDRWVPPGSKFQPVKQILDKIESAEPSDDGVRAAMEGWESTIHTRDIISVISNLKWRKALPFFNWLKGEGYKINLVAYNVLLGTFRAGRVWKEADKFVLEMIDNGIKPDNFTYSTLISCALQCNCPLEALKWFEKMPETGCVPDEVTCSTMALVYSRLGRYDDAMQLYERLRATGWKPDKISFGTMVNVYSRGGSYYKASAVIKEMQESGLLPEAVVYNTLIKYFAREGKTAQARRVFEDMEKAGVKPTEYTLSLMIDVFGRGGETKEAFKLFTRMKEEKLPLDVVVYNSLLKMCAEERLVKEAENILAGMVGRGLRPDGVTYKSVINLYSREGKLKEAEKFANRMVEVGLPLDIVVYSCLMKACGVAKDFKKVEEYYGKMVADNCSIDDKCCGVLLSIMILCDTDEERAIVQGCLRDANSRLSGILDLLRKETLNMDELEKHILAVLAESEQESHRPFCNALVDICWKVGEKERARQLLSLVDSLKVYPGGLRTTSDNLWVLHLRSLSFSAAECGLVSWIDNLREQVEHGVELPHTLAIETGAGRNRDDVTRLFNVILSKLNDMGSPFEPSSDRMDWIVSTGSACTLWLISGVQFASELP